MAETPRKAPGGKRREGREDRLKAALKANIARRKAQSRARSDGASDKPRSKD